MKFNFNEDLEHDQTDDYAELTKDLFNNRNQM